MLYSFRRCPYAMRARLAIVYSGVEIELREVELKHKPEELLRISPKATVPVLQCPDGHIIDESRDIMTWALQQNDPDGWLESIEHPLIDENDDSFKKSLDCYKYANHFPEYSQIYYREKGELFLEKLEKSLENYKFIQNNYLSFIDMAIFPFVRQFYFVNPSWFESAPYPYLNAWLQAHLSSNIFLSIMQKYPAWQAGDKATIFP